MRCITHHNNNNKPMDTCALYDVKVMMKDIENIYFSFHILSLFWKSNRTCADQVSIFFLYIALATMLCGDTNQTELFNFMHRRKVTPERFIIEHAWTGPVWFEKFNLDCAKNKLLEYPAKPHHSVMPSEESYCYS